MQIVMDEIEYSVYQTYLECEIHPMAAMIQLICVIDAEIVVVPVEPAEPAQEVQEEVQEPAKEPEGDET